jgi:hypothetical protein
MSCIIGVTAIGCVAVVIAVVAFLANGVAAVAVAVHCDVCV